MYVFLTEQLDVMQLLIGHILKTRCCSCCFFCYIKHFQMIVTCFNISVLTAKYVIINIYNFTKDVLVTR